MIEQRLERVAGRLTALRADGDVPEFGPPLPEHRVAAFEERNGVRLPDAYRRFVTTIGNGGPGPYKGLRALDADLHDPRLAGEFPYGPDDLPGLRAPSAWRAETSRWAYWGRYPGTVPLARQHDVRVEFEEWAEPESRLVLSGPGRGRVVLVDADAGWFPPMYHPAPDFLAWYEEWLDDPSAQRYRRGSDFDRPRWRVHGFRPGGDPDEAAWAVHMLAAGVGGQVSEPAPPRDCEALAEAAADATSPRVRAASAWALVRVRRDGGRYALPLLRARDPRVRHIAVGAVAASAEVDRTTAEPAIRERLTDPDPGVRAAAAAALRDDAVLRDLLADPRPRARAAALVELPVGDRTPRGRRNAFAAAARPLLRDPDPDVRAAAVTALGAAREHVPWIEPMLHAALTDPAVPVRRAATHRLLRFTGRERFPQFALVLLDDPDPVLRYEALHRLARRTPLASRVPVRHWGAAARNLLADPDPLVRAAALDALLNAGARPPEDAWASLLADPCRPARRLALVSTMSGTRHGGPHPDGPVHEALHRTLAGPDPDREHRHAASIVLRRTCRAGCRPMIAAALAVESDGSVRYSLGKLLEAISPDGTPAGP